MAFEKVQLEQFKDVFGTTTELSSEAIGGKVLSVSDEFFAAASQLLEVEPAPSMKGQFGPNGALFSGWESRRHNPAYDWCIIKLGTTGVIEGFDVDTSHFNGNEAPQVSVEALHASEDPHAGTPGWTEILPKVNLGPSSRHLFKIPTSGPVNYVKLNMYPDGGIARFRVYGHVSPVHPEGLSDLFDIGHVFSGARVEFTSDQHFGAGANLILPGRGKNMGGGWETKRSRQKGHRDWVILKLGAPGFLEHVKIDTHHFKGNFPESCEIHALYTEESVDWSNDEQKWELILPRAKLGPHREHYFQLDSPDTKYSHIKFTIYPDGGLQRIRIFGRRELPDPSKDFDTYRPIPSPTLPSFNLNGKIDPMKLRSVPVLPLTPEAFEPFGKVIQAYEDHTAAPKGTKIGPANYGTASKFHKLSLLESSYPEESGATSAISVYRCQPVDKNTDGSVTLKTLERHPYTNQAFIPMSSGAKRYLVVVAKNGDDDRPDMTSLRGFIATSCQGIVYNTAIWHQPMTVLENVMDFACVETQIGNGNKEDCEILDLKEIDMVRLTFGKPSLLPHDMTESRKRPYSDDEDSVSTTKKRATTASRNGSPQLNGVFEDEESSEKDNVELYRKEAIFRRMKHYAREHERSQTQIAELEQRKRTCEMGLAAITACWSQLIETMKPLIRDEQAIQLTGLLNFQIHVGDDWEESFQQALEAKLGATKHLVHSLVKPGTQGQIASQSFQEREKLVGECTALKSQLDIMRAEIKSLNNEKDNYHQALLSAENRLARQRSSTIQAMEIRVAAQQGSPVEVETETKGKPSSPREQMSPTHANGFADPSELEALKDAVRLRENQLVKAEDKIASLEEQLIIAKAVNHDVSEGVVREHLVYRELNNHARLLHHTLEDTQKQLLSTANDLANCQNARQEWEAGVLANANQAVNDLKTMLHKRDQDNARLRDQREHLNAEMIELKAENTSINSLLELKRFAQSQAERIAALNQQLGRYKARIAANAGKEDLMLFFANGSGDEAKYFESLETRLKTAENRVVALEQTLSGLNATHPDVSQHMKAEASARERLSVVEEELKQYKLVFGDTSTSSQDLTRELQMKEEEIQKLRLLEVQHTQAESSLYTEIEKLSSAWELLDVQVKSKVFELADVEEKMRKLSADKAKLENKFYAVMREKNEADAERKIAFRNIEKQSKAVERLKEAEESLNDQIKSLLKENGQLGVLSLSHQAEAQRLEAKVREVDAENALLRSIDKRLLPTLHELEQQYREKLKQLRVGEDDLNRTKREMEHRQKEFESLRKGGDNEDEEDENTQAFKMLQCVCRKAIRNTIITKCMHTFCKNCVDARIATRQRRCPSCNAGFAQSEVQPLYFQK